MKSNFQGNKTITIKQQILAKEFCLETHFIKLFATRSTSDLSNIKAVTDTEWKTLSWKMPLIVQWGLGDQADGNLIQFNKECHAQHPGQNTQMHWDRWKPTVWRTNPLKIFLDCDGGSQLTYKSIACPCIKQTTHTLKLLQPVNCEILCFFLLGISKAHLEQCI